jgi:Mobilization protein NikA
MATDDRRLGAPLELRPMALHATTIRFADRAYAAIARAADAQGISVSQYVREAALIRAVLDELDSAEEALHTAHDLLAIAREVRRLAEVDPPRATQVADEPRLRRPAQTASEES